MVKRNQLSSIIKSNAVFLVSVIVSLLVLIYGAVNNAGMTEISVVLMDFLNENFSWFYLLALPCLLVFLIYLAVSKWGKIKLGNPNDKPEHSTLSWFAMLFCGGTGIGLIFWSIAEPLTHYATPPFGIEAGTVEAANFSIRTCFLHWSFLPWACFAIVGLCIAYFQYNKKKNGLISNIFIPLIGDKRAKGTFGKIVDIFAILVSVAGVATSLGLGCMQICGGTEYLFGIPNTNITWLIVILIVSSIFLFSSLSGINRGIKLLSRINGVLALVLLVLAFIIGPKSVMFDTFVNGIGEHISYFLTDSLGINPYGNNSWIMNWRVFYWAWWIAWAPFVGMFIARISKGRTVRQLITAVMVIPPLFTFIWFSVFGTLALSVSGNWTLEGLAAIAASPETAVFVVFDAYPIGRVLSILIVLLLAIFFITSADSATYSLSMLSSNGSLNPPKFKIIIWTVIEAAMAFILLCTGSLKPLQIISIVAALPFLIIMILMCISLFKAFKKDHANENKD